MWHTRHACRAAHDRTRRTGRAITKALADAGLADLVLDLQDPAWRLTAPNRLRDGLHPWEDRLDDGAVRQSRATLREGKCSITSQGSPASITTS